MARYSVTGRTVLITGSTGGLGAALSQELRARGANLALLDLEADAVATQAKQLGGDTVAAGFAADVRDMSSLHKAVDAAAAHFGRIDIVVANAGIDTVAPMTTLEPASFERVIDINLNGVWRTFKAALPHVTKERGYLLAISSMAAFIHSPCRAPTRPARPASGRCATAFDSSCAAPASGSAALIPLSSRRRLWTTSTRTQPATSCGAATRRESGKWCRFNSSSARSPTGSNGVRTRSWPPRI